MIPFKRVKYLFQKLDTNTLTLWDVILTSFNSILFFISIIVAFVAYHSQFKNIGELVVYQPESFCIVRGETFENFPSDLLIIPFVFENTGRGTKTIDLPTLSLMENKGKHVFFELAGTVNQFTHLTNRESFEPRFSIVVPGHSVTRSTLVFHIENWWDQKKPENYNFEFQGGQRWEATLLYASKNESNLNKGDKILFNIPVYDTIDNLTMHGDYYSDCFSCNPKKLESIKKKVSHHSSDG